MVEHFYSFYCSFKLFDFIFLSFIILFFCLHCCCCENKIRSGQHGGANVFSRNCFVQPTWNVGDDECHVHHGRTGYGSSVQRSSQYRLWWMEVGCVSPAQHFCPPNQIIYQESAVTIWTTTQRKVFFCSACVNSSAGGSVLLLIFVIPPAAGPKC